MKLWILLFSLFEDDKLESVEHVILNQMDVSALQPKSCSNCPRIEQWKNFENLQELGKVKGKVTELPFWLAVSCLNQPSENDPMSTLQGYWLFSKVSYATFWSQYKCSFIQWHFIVIIIVYRPFSMLRFYKISFSAYRMKQWYRGVWNTSDVLGNLRCALLTWAPSSFA